MACNTNGRKRNGYRILEEQPEGRRPLRIFKHRWEDKIKM
jgi:hypothetical protein